VSPTPADVAIRPATDDDADTIVALWEAAGMLAYTPEPGDDLARTRAHDPELVLVAELDGRVVGTVTGTWDGRRGWIMRLAVDPAVRRRRIGSQLTDEVEARLRERGAQRANLLVVTHNREALAFWRERGYQSPVPVVLLSRELDGGA
jgi:ribosomal protein S18 acetylase RimI-like enzyme